MIRFTCPYGHKMSAPDDRAGKTGKCPECETLFEVPKPEEDYDETEVLVAEEILEFYCPNEHYLRSPARLQGKRGQCPECGAKFVVPTLDEEVDDEEEPEEYEEGEEPEDLEGMEEADEDEIEDETEDDESVEELSPASGSGTGSDIQPPDFSFVEQQVESSYVEPPMPDLVPVPGEQHALAGLFERIWEESPPDAIVELEMKSGERIAPLNYAHDASRGQFAVFAIQAPDGSHTVTVIAWDEVARIVVREVKDLPPTMFN